MDVRGSRGYSTGPEYKSLRDLEGHMGVSGHHQGLFFSENFAGERFWETEDQRLRCSTWIDLVDGIQFLHSMYRMLAL